MIPQNCDFSPEVHVCDATQDLNLSMVSFNKDAQQLMPFTQHANAGNKDIMSDLAGADNLKYNTESTAEIM